MLIGYTDTHVHAHTNVDGYGNHRILCNIVIYVACGLHQ